ncbi:hypothetical protein LP414_27975 [Polaromonas sp. P1(28)-13]|nr:hypothetical protein LP414_27975 [Polaromonas sp. P1(28)-13]
MIITAPSVTLPATFYGSDLSLEHCEVLAIQNIHRKLLSAEAKLFSTKWFDYRPLHPVQATYLMVHHYNRAFGDFIGTALDRSKRYTQAFKGKDFMLAREKPSFWRLRQRIDELGIRYEFFLREAMNWHIARGWGKSVMNPPRPAHLATNDEMIVDVSNAWARECRAKIQYAASPRFAVPQFVGSADQLAYEAYLIEQIKRRPSPMYALHGALYLFERCASRQQYFTSRARQSPQLRITASAT